MYQFTFAKGKQMIEEKLREWDAALAAKEKQNQVEISTLMVSEVIDLAEAPEESKVVLPIEIMEEPEENKSYSTDEVYTMNVLAQQGIVVQDHVIKPVVGDFDITVVSRMMPQMWISGEQVLDVEIPTHGYEHLSKSQWSNLSIMYDGVPRVINGTGAHIIRGMAPYINSPDIFVFRMLTKDTWITFKYEAGELQRLESTGIGWFRKVGSVYVKLSHKKGDFSFNYKPLEYWSHINGQNDIIMNIDGVDVHVTNNRTVKVTVAQIGNAYKGLSWKTEVACDLMGVNLPVGHTIEYNLDTHAFTRTHRTPDSKEIICFMRKMPKLKDFPKIDYKPLQVGGILISCNTVTTLIDCEVTQSSIALSKQKPGFHSRSAALVQCATESGLITLDFFEDWLETKRIYFRRQRPYHYLSARKDLGTERTRLIVTDVDDALLRQVLARFANVSRLYFGDHVVAFKVFSTPKYLTYMINNYKSVFKDGQFAVVMPKSGA